MAAPRPVPIANTILLPDDKSQPTNSEGVAGILRRCQVTLIADWLTRAKSTPELNHLHLSDQERPGHLPKLLDDIMALWPNPSCPVTTVTPKTPSPRSNMAGCDGHNTILPPC